MALTKISTGGVKDDAASQAIIADEAVDEARLQISNAGTNGQFLQKQSGNTGGLTWATSSSYTHPNHSGEVTSTADGAQVIADNIVDEANLKVSNSPTNGQFLSAQSGNTGGLTWADASISSSSAENTLVGTDTGSSFTGGATPDAYYNSLFGYRAGRLITTGDGNTLMGRYAGGNTTTGGYNTSFGTNAGRTITTGSNNTCVGWRAGFTTLTTGSNNMLLGHMATASSASVSNEVTVGDTNITKFRVPALSFTIDSTGVADSKGNLRSVPQKSLTNTGYTLTAADAGKHILTDTYVAIPNNVFSAGDVVTIVNNQGSGAISLTKSITNLYWTADGTDAARTLASRGVATILFVSATAAYISGSGLS